MGKDNIELMNKIKQKEQELKEKDKEIIIQNNNIELLKEILDILKSNFKIINSITNSIIEKLINNDNNELIKKIKNLETIVDFKTKIINDINCKLSKLQIDNSNKSKEIENLTESNNEKDKEIKFLSNELRKIIVNVIEEQK